MAGSTCLWGRKIFFAGEDEALDAGEVKK